MEKLSGTNEIHPNFKSKNKGIVPSLFPTGGHQGGWGHCRRAKGGFAFLRADATLPSLLWHLNNGKIGGGKYFPHQLFWWLESFCVLSILRTWCPSVKHILPWFRKARDQECHKFKDLLFPKRHKWWVLLCHFLCPLNPIKTHTGMNWSRRSHLADKMGMLFLILKFKCKTISRLSVGHRTERRVCVGGCY